MTNLVKKPALGSSRFGRSASRLAFAVLVAASVAGCRGDHAGPQVAGWSIIEPTERHPILVSKSPVTMTLPVRRGSYGLSNASRERVARFLHSFRALDTGNSRLMISAPSGTASEVAGLQVVAEVREMIKEAGFSPAIVGVEAAPGSHNVKLSYLRVVAKGPECGLWPTNLASDPANLPYPNLGCATQQNFAAMIANPADLIGPRGETPRIGDRREQIWKKYKEGQSTGAKKSEDEKVRTDQ